MKKNKATDWYLWVRYGQGHIRYVDMKKLSEKNAKIWAKKQFEKLIAKNKISECYISTGEVGDYTKIEIYKNFYWIKK